MDETEGLECDVVQSVVHPPARVAAVREKASLHIAGPPIFSS